MYSRSGLGSRNIKIRTFFCQGRNAGKDFSGNVGTGEHLAKPPFWKPSFCEPPTMGTNAQSCTLSLWMTALWTYSNRAVQIRVGLVHVSHEATPPDKATLPNLPLFLFFFSFFYLALTPSVCSAFSVCRLHFAVCLRFAAYPGVIRMFHPKNLLRFLLEITSQG